MQEAAAVAVAVRDASFDAYPPTGWIDRIGAGSPPRHSPRTLADATTAHIAPPGTSVPLGSLCWQRKASARSIEHRASLPPHSLGGALIRASLGPCCSPRIWRPPVLASACPALGTPLGTAGSLLRLAPFAWRLACPPV